MKIAFVYNTKTTWTLNDLEILKSRHKVSNVFINGLFSSFKFSNPFFILKHDLVICWFASLSYLPIIVISKVLNKKIIIFSGGYDGAAVPEILYGSYTKSYFSRFFRTLIFKSSTKVFCVSDSFANEMLLNTQIPREKTIRNYLGFSPVSIPLTPWNQREKIIVTIGAVNQETYLRKGIKYFVELTEMLPDWKFFIIGRATPEMRELIEGHRKTNLEMTGFMEDKAMSELLNKSKFYLQLSHHEAFGASVIDAALMGCYPIVYNKGALKEVVDREGSVFEMSELNKVRDEILKLANSEVNVEEKRKFYQQKYSKEKRAELLLATLDQI